MNPRHVVSPVLALRLKDAGFPQDCEFSWYVDSHAGRSVCLPSEHGDKYQLFYKWCSAPLLSEIMEQMPGVWIDHEESEPMKWRAIEPESALYKDADTGPDAAALLYLALKEGKA